MWCSSEARIQPTHSLLYPPKFAFIGQNDPPISVVKCSIEMGQNRILMSQATAPNGGRKTGKTGGCATARTRNPAVTTVDIATC